MIYAFIAVSILAFIAGLLVGRKHPKLADVVHDEGKRVTEAIKDKVKP